MEQLEDRQLLAAGPVISEFMASNATTCLDVDGDSTDWVEIHNTGTESVDLSGWSLTDDVRYLAKWPFPHVELAADGYLVVFASGKNRADSNSELHTNFKLAAAGEYVALVSPAGHVAAEFGTGGADYPPQFIDISYGITGPEVRYYSLPTPGMPNGPGAVGVVADTTFSVERGFFGTPFEVEITTTTPGATIRYTADGSRPTAVHGNDYSGPIPVDSTTILRAAAFKPELISPSVTTQTYLFLADVLQQSESFGRDGTGLPPFPAWSHHVAGHGDWEVDPVIVNHPNPENRLTAADLKSIPTLSLVLPWEDMFGGDRQGIYLYGEGIPRAVSVEQILEDGRTGFQIDASVEIQGGSSTERWKANKLSMRLQFGGAFGPKELDYPLFGDEATDRFDTVVLDAVLDFGFHHPRDTSTLNAKFIQDQFIANLQNSLGGKAPHGRFQHLYINGLYWGMYYVHERPDAAFAAAYLGGNQEDYDILKHDQLDVVSGTNQNYLAMLKLVRQDLAVDENYRELAAVLDVDEFIDYMIINYYGGNTDWGGQNWYASFNRVAPDGKWRFHSWDAEDVLSDLYVDITGNNASGSPPEIHRKLQANSEYRLLFADHVRQHFFHNGILTPARAAEAYGQLMAEVDQAIRGESARWGDDRMEYPRTRTDWLETQDDLLRDYFRLRPGIVLDQFRDRGWYPDPVAPELNVHGGSVSASSAIDLSAPAGTVYFTTDGTDPRQDGGAIAPGARAATGSFHLTRSTTVKARALDNGQWSALTSADFVVMSALPLRITELDVKPHAANLVVGLGERNVDKDLFEFVELANTGDQPIDLAGVAFTRTNVDGDRQGIAFTFAAQVLAPGARAVVVRDRAAFQSRYGPDVPVAAGNDGTGGAVGEYGGNLSNRGERITLCDANGAIIQQFDYRLGGLWPARADGYGSSMEAIDTEGDYNKPGNWRSSAEFGGSPGVEGLEADQHIVVNEIMSRPAATAVDQVELFNPTGAALDIGHWYLSNARDDFFRFQAPAPMCIPAGGYHVLSAAELGFDLDGLAGGDVWLIAADAAGRPQRFVDCVTFGASEVGGALGRWPNGSGSGLLVPMQGATFGGENRAPAAAGVVLSEVHYHPEWPANFAEDFSSGCATGFVPRQGMWTVADGRYHVIPGPEDDTIATLNALGPLTSDVRVSATVNVPAETEFKQNAAILFDYRGPDDFKFAAIHVNGNKYRIGTRDANGWTVLAELSQRVEIPPDTDMDVALDIIGTTAVLWSNGRLQLVYDFGTPLATGLVGLGSKGGQAAFDDVRVATRNTGQQFEFVELHNRTDHPIDLGGWQLRGGIELSLAPDTTLAASQSLVVVGFDPLLYAAMAEDFRRLYVLDQAVTLVGPYAGQLDDGGGIIRLLQPVSASGSQAAFVLTDQIAYSNTSPWPATADGKGHSLTRTAAAAYGADTATWRPLPPTPGTADFALPGDTDRNGRVDRNDIAGFVLALSDPAAYRQTFDVPAALAADVDFDGDVDFDDIDDLIALLSAAMPAVGAQPQDASIPPTAPTPVVDSATPVGRADGHLVHAKTFRSLVRRGQLDPRAFQTRG